MNRVAVLFFLSLLISCLPKPPGRTLIKSVSDVGAYDMQVFTLHGEKPHASLPSGRRERIADKNLIFIALDDTVQPQYEQVLMDVYQSDDVIRLEDVSWWRFAPKFQGLYHKVVYIPHDQFFVESFKKALEVAESLDRPYDLFLLTHGIPNHITTIAGEDFISYEDLQALKGKVQKLDFLYMQGCFSETLFRDFSDLGVTKMIGQNGWNRNFFFVDFFIDRYKRSKDHKKAYEKTVENIQRDMAGSLLYRKILQAMGLTLDQYFEISPDPVIFSQETH